MLLFDLVLRLLGVGTDVAELELSVSGTEVKMIHERHSENIRLRSRPYRHAPA